MQLSKEQHAVVKSTHARKVVLAGPGSGKTATVVAMIKHLLDTGTDPRGVVAITFTNAGAKELQKRLDGAPLNYIGTLHGFALRCLQKDGALLGYGPRVTVLDEEQAAEMLANAARMTGYKGTKAALELARANVRHVHRPATTAQITAAAYVRELRANSAADFETLLVDLLELCRRYRVGMEAAGAEVPPLWSHLVVDEYQDSGPLDALIYEAMPVQNRCFVGDPDQAIYGFRGATVENILRCTPAAGWEVHTLEGNYRCSGLVCSAANRLIEHNANRIAKRTLSMRHDVVGKVLVRPDMGIDEEERAQVLGNIAQILRNGTPPSEVAVLARYNATVKEFSEAAEAMGIPVRRKQAPVPGKLVAIARAAVELLNAPQNALACRQWLRVKHGKEVATKAEREAAKRQCPLAELVLDHVTPGVTAGTLLDALARLGLEPAAVELVQEKLASMPDNPELGAVSLALARDLDHVEEMGQGVTFTTMHGAKGREWGTVYLVALEQEITPGTSGKRDQEEERRLVFVGITRAKDRLLMSAARKRRQTWGDGRHADSTPSQFLAETQVL